MVGERAHDLLANCSTYHAVWLWGPVEQGMRRLLSSIAISWIVMPGSAFGQTGGRNLYIAKCAACHASDASGNNTIGRSLELTDMRPAIKSMTDEQLRQIILEGKGKMPPTKKFDDEKLRNVTVFLRELAAGNPSAGRALAQAEGQPLAPVQKIFRDKCSACHAQDGAGRTTIGNSLKVPDLTSMAVQSQGDEELTHVISVGKSRMPGYTKTLGVGQATQLVSYIRELAKSGSPKGLVQSAKGQTSTPQPPSWLPAQGTAQQASVPPSPTSAASTLLLKSPAADERKTATPKPTTAAIDAKAPRSGRQIYVAKCSACHSSDGTGTGTIGKNMRIPNLASSQVQGHSDESLVSVISNGAGKMPRYKKKYSPEQIQLVVLYLRELAKEH